MSLLNEALRKSKARDQSTVLAGFPLEPPPKPKRSLLIPILVISVLVICSLSLIWLRQISDESRLLAVSIAPETTERVVKTDKHVDTPKLQSQNTLENIALHSEPKKKIAVEEKKEIPLPDISETQESKKTKKETLSDKPPATEKNLKDKDNFYHKALQSHRHGSLEKAISMYKEVLRHNPEHIEAQFNLASVYIQRSEFSSAYPLLNKLSALNPTDARVLLNLGIAEIGLGKNRDAVSHLKDIHGVDQDLQFSLFFHLGVGMSRLGELEEALDWYLKAEALQHDHAGLIFNMAVLNDKLGNYREAVDYYLRLLANNSLPAIERDKVQHRVKILQTHVLTSPQGKAP